MRCPFCGLADSKVLETRARKGPLGDAAMYRRRECLSDTCGERWSTFELREEMLTSGQRRRLDARRRGLFRRGAGGEG
jgi:transcriptional regulator NrdR family protein